MVEKVNQQVMNEKQQLGPYKYLSSISENNQNMKENKFEKPLYDYIQYQNQQILNWKKQNKINVF
ncbi:hypothetical protein ABPG73_011945, partial [Tetrahymena malaccensis]